MSITDKLPKAPEGFIWKTSVSVSTDDTKIYVRLENPHGALRVPESNLATFRFSAPDEGSVLAAARSILDHFERSVQIAEYLDLKRAEASEVYADLLTEN